jgi:hypothetical protein
MKTETYVLVFLGRTDGDIECVTCTASSLASTIKSRKLTAYDYEVIKGTVLSAKEINSLLKGK